MPLYEFNCAGCGPFTLARKVSDAGSPAQCPTCDGPAVKIFPLVNLRAMSAANRKAWARNERSAHQPHVCHSGCSHRGTKPKQRAESTGKKPALQYSRKRNSRPWMLGH